MSARPPWWSAADEAEFEMLVHELVEAGWAHRSCARCRALNTWCEPMAAAFGAVVDWRRSRGYRSKADWLRRRELARYLNQLERRTAA